MTKPKNSRTPIKLPSQEYLHLNFYYNPKFGKMYARNVSGAHPIGRSGCIKGGYLIRHVNGKDYREHRLIWVYHYGVDPGRKHIDHIDGNPLNNKIDNLRLVTQRQNSQNQTKAKGYTWHKRAKKWISNIVYRGKKKHLGYFLTEEQAKQAYDDARQKYFKEYAPKYI